MAPIRQTNFSAGELSPSRWGRTDLPEYGKGCRRLFNFFVSRHGEAVSRPGTVLAGEYPVEVPPYIRLIPFIYSDEDAYVLVFGDTKLYFIKEGAWVEDGENQPFDIDTPYTIDEVPDISYVQSGDILTLTHPAHPPMELSRLAPNSWLLEEFDFTRIPMGDVVHNPMDPTQLQQAPLFAHRWAASHFYLLGQTVMNGGESYEVTQQGTSAASGGPSGHGEIISDNTAIWRWRGDKEHPAREWKWKVTAMLQNTETGETAESLPYDVARVGYPGVTNDVSTPFPASFAILGPDRPITLRRPTTSAGLLSLPAGWEDYREISFNYYRGRGDLFGFIGQSKETEFVDTGSEPNYAIQPPRGDNPFTVYDIDNAVVRIENPVCCAYFQERLAFGGTPERPDTLFLSATGDYINFDRQVLSPPGSALEFRLLTRKRESIRSILDLGRLLVFCSNSVRSIAGHQGEPLDAESVDAKVIEEIGANKLQPLVVDGCALYARAKGQGVRALAPSQAMGGFTGADVSVISQHLFVGSFGESIDTQESFTLIDWCYQEDPWGVVWAVRSDGALLSLTFNPQESVWGWTQHETDGEVMAICSIPETDEDGVYIAVVRDTGDEPRLCFERFSSRVRKGGLYDDVCVDSAERYVGVVTDTFTGLERFEGKEVWVLVVGMEPQGPLTVVGGTVTLDAMPPETFGGLLVAHIGQAFTCELETLDIAESSVRSKRKTVTEICFEVGESFSLEAGQDFEHLSPWARTVDEGNTLLSAATELVRVPVDGKWDESARACLRQSEPRPLTVLGITREVDFGD